MLFAPRDDVAGALELLVGSLTRSAKVEMFTYCDAKLDAELHEKASTPGFDFQATFDRSQTIEVASMQKLVAGWGADQRVAVGKSEHGQIIHRKVIVGDGVWVAGGSTNWTADGERLEDNELVIRRSPPLAAWYAAVLDANFARVRAAMTTASCPWRS